MKKLLTLTAALLLAVSSLQAEQIFVLFDGSCGDRVKYEQSVAQQPRTDYYAYHFSFQGGDRLLLETGAEGATVQNFLPQGYLYCGDPRLNLELANRVNGGVDRVFILLPAANNQYIIQPVVMASVMQRRGATFSYFSPLTGFQFDTENGIIGENLAVNNEGAKVYFEGRETSPCAGYFLFRQLKVGGAYPVIDYKVSPEIGIYERRLGSDGISTTGGVIVAREVNGVPLANYLSSVCASSTALAQNNGGAPANQQPQPDAYGTQQPAPAQPYYGQPQGQLSQPESVAYAQANPQAPVPVTTVNHTVARGETLYAVSRKYNTTVDAIKASNGLSSNTLFPGQQLAISTTSVASGNAVALSPTVPTAPYNPGNVANSNPGAAQPTPYGATATPQAYGTQQTARGQTAVYGEDTHMVQPGETVASIALRYGYTSAKFREMNDLGPNDVVRIGEQLKTTNCNCPVQEAAPAPAAYGQPAATSQSYGQPAAAPQAYGQQATTPQAYGNQPAGNQPATEAYRTPQGYQAPQASPVPATNTPQAPAPTTITNNPNFGQVVPNASAPPSSTMGQLEARGNPAPQAQPTTNPATYNAYPAPAPAPNQYQSPNPVPNAYGTPVGVNTQPAAQPNNRAFHLVQDGESLFSISRRYGITTDQLRALNNLDNGTVIVPFQKLYVN